MWILTGAFDTEDLSFQKSKLLKTGNTYPLGRKGQPLLVKSKKVSQLHCRFTVEEISLDDVHDPERQPALTVHNERDKTISLTRAGGLMSIEARSMGELQDGDVINLVYGVAITVKWQTLCCYFPSLQGRSNVSLETCRQMGISVVYTPNSYVSHHILPTYIANASVATSLVSAAQFVKLEWLLEILRNADSLEENYTTSSLSKHRPTFSPSLNPSQKVFKVWEPNEERLNMFSEYRFLVFGEKTREIESHLRELIKRAGGFLETFDVAGGAAKLHKALARGQAKEAQRLVVVANARDMETAIGQDDWVKLVAEVRSFELHITHPETVVQAVIDVNPALLTACQPSPVGILDSTISMTSLPVFVPNSIPDEPSVPPEDPPARKRLHRRAASRQASVEPIAGIVHEEAKDESPRPRRLLLSRRGGTVEPIDSASASNQPPSDQNAMPVPPTPGRLRLKRRLGATPAGVQSQLPDIASYMDDDEPPLKKFKALFDASNPTRVGTGSYDEDVLPNTNNEDLMTQTQSQTEGFVRRAATRSGLAALREEEEEDSYASGGQTQGGKKRALDSVQMEDREVEMIVVEDEGAAGQPVREKQVSESANQVQKTAEIASSTLNSPKTNRKEKERKPGAPLGKPDTDVEFLKAVASTKRGKRAEDAFDREFNNLRISKLKVAEAEKQRVVEEEEEWRKFVDFGDDAGLRGNFMVVLEMDVYQLKEGGRNQSDIPRGVSLRKESVVPDQWKDQPNFKKFKKKVPSTRGALVELFANEDNDFDAAPTHWRSKKSNQTQRTASFPEMDVKPRNLLPHSGSRAKKLALSDDDSGDNQPPEFGKSNALLNRTIQNEHKALSRTGSQIHSIHTASKPSSRASSILLPKQTASKSSGQVLFLDSDDDIEELDEHQTQSEFRGGNEDEDENEQTLRSSGTTTRRPMNVSEAPRTTARKRRRVAADDDSDDGVVFKGFGAGRRKRLKQ